MIEFHAVSKYYRSAGARRDILTDASLELPPRNIAILGLNGSGKSTLIRMIAGAELPNTGAVIRRVGVSWPLGFSGALNANASGVQNVKFISRLYDRPFARTLAQVEDLAELGDFIRAPVKTYSSGMRARLALSLSMAIDFDCYLIDEITGVGDARFRERFAEAFQRKRTEARVIMVSHSVSTVRQFCDMGAVLHDGRLQLYSTLDKAIIAYSSLLAISQGAA